MNDFENPVRTCENLRSVVITDDAGVNHRINKYCGNLLASHQMYCERCEAEKRPDRTVEIQR